MNWKTIAVTIDDQQFDDSIDQKVDELEQIFWSEGAVSVSITDAADSPIFEPGVGEIPLWSSVTLAAMFEQQIDLAPVSSRVKESGFEVLFTEELGDRVWEREWLSRFKPMQFGRRLWVCPSGYEVNEADAVIMDLDPGLAFGTGTHATTGMCLRWLDENLRPGIRVLDYGCGSGILGIAALLLGAAKVDAVDNDPQALVATRDNANRNQVELGTSLPGGTGEPEYELVVANILAQPLIELAPMLCNLVSLEGDILLSGIMDSQADQVLNAYPIRLVEKYDLDGWVCLHLSRKTTDSQDGEKAEQSHD